MADQVHDTESDDATGSDVSPSGLFLASKTRWGHPSRSEEFEHAPKLRRVKPERVIGRVEAG